jgi:glycerol-3-phosphate dehydrogenase (NAD+)
MTEVIGKELGIEMSALSGANIASEVANEKFCETTIGSKNAESGILFKKLFQTPYFRVNVIRDVDAPQVCGALKNIVGLAAGFVDGMNLGDNSKAAIVRLGLVEMLKFSKQYFNGVEDSTFFESCGVADLITTCNGGRHRKLAALHVQTRKSFADLEKSELNGQKLQGTLTAKEVHVFLEKKGVDIAKEYPLFHSVYRIVYEGYAPENIITDVVQD